MPSCARRWSRMVTRCLSLSRDDSLRTEFNMVGKSAKQRGDWAKDLGIKDLAKEKAGIVFHAGLPFSPLTAICRTSPRSA